MSDPTLSDPTANAVATSAAQSANAQPTAAAGQQGGGNTTDAAKAEGAASFASTIAAAASSHEHSAVGVAANALTADGSTQTTGSIQPPLNAPAASPGSAASLSVTAASNAAVPLSGLALEIAASARNGKSSFEIRLDPAELGRIDVRVDVDRNGQVTSHLTVEKPETLSMLQQDAPQLQRALDDAGLKTGSGGLQFSLRDQSSSGQGDGSGSGRNAQRLIINSEDTVPAAIAGRTYGQMLGSSGGVDISV